MEGTGCAGGKRNITKEHEVIAQRTLSSRLRREKEVHGVKVRMKRWPEG